ncbi:restriction endonuclease [Paralcaligenes sp. KSB-10]|uniref:BglII/BstYI family type II restriction endonuclease n=1 Tax=Paralcaligenes sp. KSB-10 TaxID=2901142 RepID=UPI001E549FA3|nr:BglII/BstYI family type II restriction endonuclease [Paralcaligenes sp. KSB-10]UHL63508.1 restriction endonuclease [Paralcaligenes sp. KSB-10]
MYETDTFNDASILIPAFRDRWKMMETNSACAIMKSVCPDEWADIVYVLQTFALAPSTWLRRGGNRGMVPKILDGMLQSRGWIETRIDLETQGILINKGGSERARLEPIHQEGYLVDNFKGRVVVDVEWNAKDGNIDRDLSAYRAWHEAGVISAAVLITQDREPLKALAERIWAEYQQTLSEGERDPRLPIDLNTSTTTNFEKVQLRVRRGVMGTCPLLVVAACHATWNGEPYTRA